MSQPTAQIYIHGSPTVLDVKGLQAEYDANFQKFLDNTTLAYATTVQRFLNELNTKKDYFKKPRHSILRGSSSAKQPEYEFTVRTTPPSEKNLVYLLTTGITESNYKDYIVAIRYFLQTYYDYNSRLGKVLFHGFTGGSATHILDVDGEAFNLKDLIEAIGVQYSTSDQLGGSRKSRSRQARTRKARKSCFRQARYRQARSRQASSRKRSGRQSQ